MWLNDFSLWFTVFSCPFLVLFFMICYAFSYCLFSEMMAAENSSEPAQGNFFSSIISVFGLDMHRNRVLFGLEMLDFAYFRLDF